MAPSGMTSGSGTVPAATLTVSVVASVRTVLIVDVVVVVLLLMQRLGWRTFPLISGGKK